MKKVFLFFDELKDNLSDFIINTLIITLAAVFISIAVHSVGDYMTSLAYYLNPNTGNIVKIIPQSPESVYDKELFALEEFEYSFTASIYEGAVKGSSISLITVTEDFFDEGLGLSGGVSWDTVSEASGKINLIATAGADLSEGAEGTMADGTPYLVVKKWENESPYRLLSGMLTPTSAVIAIDSAVNTDGLQLWDQTVVGKINISSERFIEKYQETMPEKGWAVISFNGIGMVAGEFESSVMLTLLGTVIFLTACIAIIINNYLSYEKRKRAYEILITLGARKRVFMINSLLTRMAQLMLSVGLSAAAFAAVEAVFGTEMVSAGSVLIAFGAVTLLLAGGFVRYVFFLRRTGAVR